MAACLLASGIDPEKSILFQQSQVCYVCFKLIETVSLMKTDYLEVDNLSMQGPVFISLSTLCN